MVGDKRRPRSGVRDDGAPGRGGWVMYPRSSGDGGAYANSSLRIPKISRKIPDKSRGLFTTTIFKAVTSLSVCLSGLLISVRRSIPEESKRKQTEPPPAAGKTPEIAAPPPQSRRRPGESSKDRNAGIVSSFILLFRGPGWGFPPRRFHFIIRQGKERVH